MTRFFSFFSASRSARLTLRSSDSFGEVMTTAISVFNAFMSAPFLVVAGAKMPGRTENTEQAGVGCQPRVGEGWMWLTAPWTRHTASCEIVGRRA